MVIKLKRMLLIVALIIVIAFSFKIYALATSEGVWPEKDQGSPMLENIN